MDFFIIIVVCILVSFNRIFYFNDLNSFTYIISLYGLLTSVFFFIYY